MANRERSKLRWQWKAHKMVWNLSGGRLGRTVLGMPVVELVTRGHKTGQERQILITYVEDKGMPAIIGTNAGKDVDPAWVKNLRANPQARARWAGTWRDVTGVELKGDDHERVWERGVAANGGFEQYREHLTRPIPIIRLEPVR